MRLERQRGARSWLGFSALAAPVNQLGGTLKILSVPKPQPVIEMFDCDGRGPGV